MKLENNIKNDWKEIIETEMQKPYFVEINKKIETDLNSGITIYPPLNLVFNAFEKTPFKDIKVVILGQDPYHGIGQAQGFCFSVPENIKLPPSLKNIYKEIEASLGIKNSNSGDLTPWTKQGVFLLNAILTVQAGNPASHSKIGWEKFTNEIIKSISDEKENVIFLLWGAFAQGKKSLIDTNKHIVLESPHPSPFSAHRGFLGNNHFKSVNEILKKQGKKEIDWKI
ncbi:MAG: uracil-DNA glycosylase [Candidatus Gracilibacteria bacterium]|nr:uracil-DNA glycosylase [Candidatus Gracilibacteria bacterium]